MVNILDLSEKICFFNTLYHVLFNLECYYSRPYVPGFTQSMKRDVLLGISEAKANCLLIINKLLSYT